MTKILTWVKQNKLSAVLAAALIYILSQNVLAGLFGIATTNRTFMEGDNFGSLQGARGIAKTSDMTSSYMLPSPIEDVAPTTGTPRLVIKDTTLSLVTSAVDQAITQIETIATQAGGYMVNSDLSLPEGAASGTITIRIPTAQREAVLAAVKNTGTKVVSETIFGQDITDQYEDINTKIQNLNTTKAKFETILNQATSVPQILEVTRELSNLQTQIDNLKGRQQYLAKSAETSKITVNLSTDELALPYAPDKAWRPQVIAKQAVRSLIGTLRGLGTTLIWIAVYSPVLIVVLVLVRLFKRKSHPKTI